MTQTSLSEHIQTDTKENANKGSSDDTSNNSSTQQHRTPTITVPEDYPTKTIEDRGEKTHVFTLQAEGETKDIAVQKMECLDSSIGETLEHAPLIISPDSISPAGSQLVLGTVTDYTVSNTTTSLTVSRVVEANKHAFGSKTERSYNVNNAAIAIPIRAKDSQALKTVLNDRLNEKTDSIKPEVQQEWDDRRKAIQRFQSLSIGDTINTGFYSTPLTVLSECWTTAAIVSKMHGSNKEIAVYSRTVSNPRGGYYQIGVRTSPTNPESTTHSDRHQAYISQSNSTPPTPNTAFNVANRADAKEFRKGDTKSVDEPVEADLSIEQTPLPEPRLRTQLTEIDGIGEKTSRKIFRLTDNRTSVESIAHTLYNDGDIHRQHIREIESIISSLPKNEAIFDRLQRAANRINDTK